MAEAKAQEIVDNYVESYLKTGEAKNTIRVGKQVFSVQEKYGKGPNVKHEAQIAKDLTNHMMEVRAELLTEDGYHVPDMPLNAFKPGTDILTSFYDHPEGHKVLRIGDIINMKSVGEDGKIHYKKAEIRNLSSVKREVQGKSYQKGGGFHPEADKGPVDFTDKNWKEPQNSLVRVVNSDFYGKVIDRVNGIKELLKKYKNHSDVSPGTMAQLKHEQIINVVQDDRSGKVYPVPTSMLRKWKPWGIEDLHDEAATKPGDVIAYGKGTYKVLDMQKSGILAIDRDGAQHLIPTKYASKIDNYKGAAFPDYVNQDIQPTSHFETGYENKYAKLTLDEIAKFEKGNYENIPKKQSEFSPEAKLQIRAEGLKKNRSFTGELPRYQGESELSSVKRINPALRAVLESRNALKKSPNIGLSLDIVDDNMRKGKSLGGGAADDGIKINGTVMHPKQVLDDSINGKIKPLESLKLWTNKDNIQKLVNSVVTDNTIKGGNFDSIRNQLFAVDGKSGYIDRLMKHVENTSAGITKFHEAITPLIEKEFTSAEQDVISKKYEQSGKEKALEEFTGNKLKAATALIEGHESHAAASAITRYIPSEFLKENYVQHHVTEQVIKDKIARELSNSPQEMLRKANEKEVARKIIEEDPYKHIQDMGEKERSNLPWIGDAKGLAASSMTRHQTVVKNMAVDTIAALKQHALERVEPAQKHLEMLNDSIKKLEAKPDKTDADLTELNHMYTLKETDPLYDSKGWERLANESDKIANTLRGQVSDFDKWTMKQFDKHPNALSFAVHAAQFLKSGNFEFRNPKITKYEGRNIIEADVIDQGKWTKKYFTPQELLGNKVGSNVSSMVTSMGASAKIGYLLGPALSNLSQITNPISFLPVDLKSLIAVGEGLTDTFKHYGNAITDPYKHAAETAKYASEGTVMTHFMDLENLKKYSDLNAYGKFNKFLNDSFGLIASTEKFANIAGRNIIARYLRKTGMNEAEAGALAAEVNREGNFKFDIQDRPHWRDNPAIRPLAIFTNYLEKTFRTGAEFLKEENPVLKRFHDQINKGKDPKSLINQMNNSQRAIVFKWFATAATLTLISNLLFGKQGNNMDPRRSFTRIGLYRSSILYGSLKAAGKLATGHPIKAAGELASTIVPGASMLKDTAKSGKELISGDIKDPGKAAVQVADMFLF